MTNKYNLTIKEASEYYNIGENKLRELIKQDCWEVVLYIGKKALMKRKQFEEYLDKVTYL